MTGLTIDNKYTFLHCVFEMIDGKETGMLIVCSTCVLNTSELKYTGNKHTDHSGTGQRYVGLCIRLALISHTRLHTHIHTPPQTTFLCKQTHACTHTLDPHLGQQKAVQSMSPPPPFPSISSQSFHSTHLALKGLSDYQT